MKYRVVERSKFAGIGDCEISSLSFYCSNESQIEVNQFF